VHRLEDPPAAGTGVAATAAPAAPEAPAGSTDHLLIFVDGKPFWLYLAASPAATLADLDDLLRRTWLECCGHLSQFIIRGRRFISYDDKDGFEPTESMDVRIADALPGEREFWHEYDFGSATRLRLTTIGPIAEPAIPTAADDAQPARSPRRGAAREGSAQLTLIADDQAQREPSPQPSLGISAEGEKTR
jgi:hypothetical protein